VASGSSAIGRPINSESQVRGFQSQHWNQERENVGDQQQLVEQLTHNPKIEGSNPNTETRRGEMLKKSFILGDQQQLIEQLTHNNKIVGSNPVTGTKREKITTSAVGRTMDTQSRYCRFKYIVNDVDTTKSSS
jgi:hypothetical protein